MIVRGAYLEGRVAPEHVETFDAFITREVVPIMERFAGIRSVRVMRALSVEDDGPHIHMSFESVYDSEQAMDYAFSLPVRQELKAKMKEISHLFTGRLFHITHHLIVDKSVHAVTAA